MTQESKSEIIRMYGSQAMVSPDEMLADAKALLVAAQELFYDAPDFAIYGHDHLLSMAIGCLSKILRGTGMKRKRCPRRNANELN